jgi:ferredoxin
LEVVEDETGKHAAVKCPDKCTACGDCLGKCRFNALKLVERQAATHQSVKNGSTIAP